MTEDTSARRPLFKVFSFASYYSDPSDASPCGETAGGTKTTVVFRLDDPLFTFRTEREKERCAPYDFGAHDGAPRFCTVSTGGAHSRNTYPCTRNRPCMEPTGNETSEKKEQTKRGTRDKKNRQTTPLSLLSSAAATAYGTVLCIWGGALYAATFCSLLFPSAVTVYQMPRGTSFAGYIFFTFYFIFVFIFQIFRWSPPTDCKR